MKQKCHMIPQPSISSLFHELFEGEWPTDDPQFLEEVSKFETILRKMLSTDIQLTNIIKTQTLLDNDQISSVPIIQSVTKVQLVASLQPNGPQTLFTLVTSPLNISQIFESVTVEAGNTQFQYVSSEKSTDSIRASIDIRVPMINIICKWNIPLLQMSPPMQKFMGKQYAMSHEIISKLLSHIESRNIANNGEVKCDRTLSALTSDDSFSIQSLADIVESNTFPLDNFTFSLNVPESSRAFSLHVPTLSTNEMSQFVPLEVPEPPITDLLKTAIESKNQLLAIRAFEIEPTEFVEEMTLQEARRQDISDLENSSYFFWQPWVLDAASDYIKASEYSKIDAKHVPMPQIPTKG